MSRAIGDLALDTNAAIAYLQGDPRAVAWVEAADALFLAVISYGELTYGALHSSRPVDNLAKLAPLIESCAILDVTRSIAEGYGEIRQDLAAKGNPIPEADLWIAAVCREHDLAILSEDAHFDRVPGLTRHDWTQPPS